MNRIYLILLAVCLGVVSAQAASVVRVTVENISSLAQNNVPVVVPVSKLSTKSGIKIVSAAVNVASKQIASQLDDLNRDGSADELVFLVNLKSKQKLTVSVKVASDSSLYKKFPKKTHAQMWRKDPNTKAIIPTVEESSPTGNLYRSLHHHGPAIESEYMAYRLYFDEKQTVDLYGKKKHQLELMDTKWYPTDQQIAEGYGDDILWVKATAGCGTIKGWDGKKVTHISPVSNRTGRVIASGPVRSIIEMEADGWQYGGKTIDIKQRYIIYAGHRDMEVQVTQNKSTTLCTGVQTFFDTAEKMTDVTGVVAIWGTGLQYPVTDNVRAKPQTVGMAVSVPESVLKQSVSDKDNLLLLLEGKNFTYHITAAWEQEEGGFKQSKDFFDYVKKWNQQLQHPAKVSVLFY
ncbi:MAG: hypothetical protein H6Q17_1421 [Bacteroidetes bacterium]|nr:hypothetical protein [Bacteroidota bacterium]